MRSKITEIEMIMNPNTFLQLHEVNEFPAGTSLLVRESQEALLILNGELADQFGPGRYTLNTATLPLLVRLMAKLPISRFQKHFQSQKTFRAEIYFINKLERRGLKWGLDTKINYMDPNFNNYPFPVGASGELSLKVIDSVRLIQKLSGTTKQLDESGLFDYFLAPIMTHVKSYLPSILVNLGASIYDIDKHMKEISHNLRQQLNQEMVPYGLELSMFNIMRFLLPENDKYFRELKALKGDQFVSIGRATLERDLAYIKQDTAARGMTVDAQAQATKRQIENYTYQDEQQFHIMQIQASQPAYVQCTPTSQQSIPTQIQLPIYQTQQASNPMTNFKELVDRLSYMKSSGILTDDEFQEEKRKLIEQMLNI